MTYCHGSRQQGHSRGLYAQYGPAYANGDKTRRQSCRPLRLGNIAFRPDEKANPPASVPVRQHFRQGNRRVGKVAQQGQVAGDILHQTSQVYRLIYSWQEVQFALLRRRDAAGPPTLPFGLAEPAGPGDASFEVDRLKRSCTKLSGLFQ